MFAALAAAALAFATPAAFEPTTPEYWVRNAVPAVEAYNADHPHGYTGMTVAALRAYDASIGHLRIVRATTTTYCIESTLGGKSAFKNGPPREILRGTCANPAAGRPIREVVMHEPPEIRIRAAIPAIEAYNADHGTYRGMTLAKLRGTYDYGIMNVSFPWIRSHRYCVQSSDLGRTAHKRGPEGPIARGACPPA